MLAYQKLALTFWLLIVPVPPMVVRNDELTLKDICYYLYEETSFDNVVISPGPGSPTCPADIGEFFRSEFIFAMLFPRLFPRCMAE